jgi:DNA-binding GntR family transcriptional regulator
MPKLGKDNLRSQREKAYESLRSLLILQQVEAGQRLREPEWAARLGVHRSALREAFARLAAEGLVERGAQTGYFVPRLGPEDVAEVTKIRLALECLAIDEVCGDAGIALEAVERACDEFEAFLKGGYALGVIEADRRFHEAIVDAAGMRRLSGLYLRAPLPLINRRTEDREFWMAECVRTLEEHRAILSALQRRDALVAKNLLRAHISHRPNLPFRR